MHGRMAEDRSLWILVLLGLVLPSLANIYLTPIVTTYLPYSLDPYPKFGFDKGATEQIALDAEKQILYAVGNSNLFALDVSDPGQQRVVAEYSLSSNLHFEDVLVCGDFIYTTVVIQDDKLHGKVKLFTYNAKYKKLSLFTTIPVGSQPDTLAITKDCRTIVVTLEGQPFVDDKDNIIDPEGGIGVLRWDPKKPDDGVQYTELDFKKANVRKHELLDAGVRFVMKGDGNKISQDLEPEGVTLNAAETRAYVTLQENNAILVVDISNGNKPVFIDIFGLGTKSFKRSELDPSIADGRINFERWPIKGFYQPDGIKSFIHEGVEYFVIANEGSPKFINGSKGVLFKEVKSGSMIVSDDEVDETVPKSLKDALADNTKLGQMRFSTLSGRNPVNKKFKKFFIYGARSFSLIRTSDLSMVFESGASIGKSIAKKYPEFFNARAIGDKKPSELLENQSPISGNDPEDVEVGKAFGKTLLFIGNEHPGTISIYSMDKKDSTPKFESVYIGTKAKPGETWNDIYNDLRTGDIDPEDLIFVPGSKSATGKPILFVTGTVSGTVTCYNVKYAAKPKKIKPKQPNSHNKNSKKPTKPDQKKPTRPKPYKPYLPQDNKPQKPDERRSQRPQERKTQRPGDKRTQRPQARKTQHPKERKTQRPAEKKTKRPAERKTQRPEGRKNQRPEERNNQRPEERKNQRPEERKNQRPEERKNQRTENKRTQRPAERKTQRPEERKNQRPEERKNQRPEERKNQRPEERKNQRPEDKRTQRPAERTTQRPEERKTQRPEERKTQRPEERKAQRPEERKAQRPEERKAQRDSIPTIPKTESHGYYRGQISQRDEPNHPKY